MTPEQLEVRRVRFEELWLKNTGFETQKDEKGYYYDDQQAAWQAYQWGMADAAPAAPAVLWGRDDYHPPLPREGDKYTTIYEDDNGDYATVVRIMNKNTPNIAYVYLMWENLHYLTVRIDKFWEKYVQVSTQHLDADSAQRADQLPQQSAQPVAWMRDDEMKAITDDEKQAWIAADRKEAVEEYTKPLIHAAARPVEVRQLCWNCGCNFKA